MANRHHEQYFCVQCTFQKDFKTVIEEFGNPFLEKGQDLLILDARNIMDNNFSVAHHLVDYLDSQYLRTKHLPSVCGVMIVALRSAGLFSIFLVS